LSPLSGSACISYSCLCPVIGYHNLAYSPFARCHGD
jgi:hypothetical protein